MTSMYPSPGSTLSSVSDAYDTDSTAAVKSKDTISKSVDAAMDKANGNTNGVTAGISIRNGPVDEMDVDGPVNGAVTGKRKSRGSIPNGKSYKDASDSDDAPIVSCMFSFLRPSD